MSRPDPTPTDIVMQLIGGPWLSQAVYVAAKLDLSEKLAAGPRTAAQLAEGSHVDAGALHRVLRALVGVGVYADAGDGRFANTPVSEVLRIGVAGSVRDMAVMFGEDFHTRPVAALMHCVKTGQPSFDHIFGMGAFDYFRANAEQGEIFNRAMTSFSGPNAEAVVGAYDFSGIKTLVDVGGGHGALLDRVLQATPATSGILYDLPFVAEGARAHFAKAATGPRVKVEQGSFFESVPAGGDAYMMKHIIHDWSDAHCEKLLANVRKVIPKDGRLLVIEMLVPGGPAMHPSKLLDIEMLVMTQGGRERTEAEFRALYAKAGFKLTRVVPTKGAISVIEGSPI